jgi:hypothetical protein
MGTVGKRVLSTVSFCKVPSEHLSHETPWTVIRDNLVGNRAPFVSSNVPTSPFSQHVCPETSQRTSSMTTLVKRPAWYILDRVETNVFDLAIFSGVT